MELGEEKEREIMMLRNSLKVMEDNVYEMNAMLAKEQEAAGKAIEEAPPVFKAPILVQNTKKMGSPTAEVEHLMVIVYIHVLSFWCFQYPTEY